MRRSSSVASLALLTLAFAAGGGTAGCSDDEAAPKQEIGVAKSSLARDTSPNVSDAERDAFADERADFAVDLLKKVAEEKPGNLLVSPHSASMALAMTYAGTSGDAKAGMAKALRFSAPDDRLHALFNATDLALASRQHEPQYEGAGAVQLSSANSLWSQKGTDYENGFLDTLAKSYGAGVNLVDFRGAANDGACRAINGWVSDKTQTQIPELLSPQDTQDAKWVLVNAIYMKANWASRFDKAATVDGTFITASGASVTVPMMKAQYSMMAFHHEDFDAVEIPYDGGQLAMLAIVPAAGKYATFESSFTGKTIRDLALEPYLVDLTMPKFQVRSTIPMTKSLRALGMPTSGDFPGPADLINVIQETMLVADEDGTEAAAATAVIGLRTSAPNVPPKSLEISIDRPFLYAVVDRPTGTILFLGKTLDPSQK